MCRAVFIVFNDLSASGTDVIALCFKEASFYSDAHLEDKRPRTGLESSCLYSHL